MGYHYSYTHPLPNGNEVALPHLPEDFLLDAIRVALLPDGNYGVAYLVHDDDCSNPLDDCDGLGKIYHHPCSRYGWSRHENRYYEVLALDRDGQPNLKLDQVEDQYVALLSQQDLADEGLDSDEADSLRLEAWEIARQAGEIGDPDALLLDIYAHGQRKYSVGGEGFTCRWDTTQGEAVWVPDDSARVAIGDQAKVLAFGQITELQSQFLATFEPARRNDSETFDAWHKAYAWLRTVAKAEGWVVTPEELAQGRQRALAHIARSCVAEYDAWQRGECYGVISFICDSDGNLLGESDDCYGYVGSDAAESERDDRLNSLIDFYRRAA